MPQLGFGVWQVPDDEAERAVATALEAGYRSIDTAAIYGNEEGTGKAIATAGIPRADLFVTTKLWNSDQGYDSTLRAFDVSLEKLGLDYIDLYLIHWPLPTRGQFVETYKAFEKIYADGRAKAIGVSNFLPSTSGRSSTRRRSSRRSTRSSCTRTFSSTPRASSTRSTASRPRPGRRSARARASWRSRRSSRSPGSTNAPRPRSCCAGTSSSATS
ncbi:hypothetical protein SAV31267_077850 [Streptomyces avermitilis]|uniref:NADP-dependent oxidoreductase domain-containing protein n=1 Tax=Streptomyces avermitilis TaxID=33903 RepID=A0A4D4N1E8_STRAX|nr:hypothetical protein SAV31267_077850 [Streptomyces avermitilis]